MQDKKALAIKTLADWASRGAALSATQRQAIRQPRLLDQIGSPVTIDEDLLEEESFIESELKEGLTDDRHHLTLEEYSNTTPTEWVVEWAGREIQQSDWKPEDVRDDNKDPLFREFILSHIPRFDKIGHFKPFYLYLEQARRWHNETKDIEVTDLDDSEAYTFVRKEYRRMQQNKLYALNRYVKIKDDQYPEGRPYWAGVPQALLCFLMDRGNNLVLLKGRQAAITSTMMAIAVIEMLMRNNYSSVLLTDDKLKTGIDILSKKVQATFQLLPEWIRQNVVDALWAKEYVELDFEHAGSKMEKRRNSSGLNLISADDTQAVNSKTPTHTFYDEVQNISTYGIIKREVKPTQLSRMPDGTIKMVRQQAAWGTGSSNDKGKGVFEKDWRDTFKGVEDGVPTGGWVALFFDWTCRPGFTSDDYMKQKQEDLYNSEHDGETALAIFNAHYPSHPDDAFMKVHNGVVPAIVIKRNRDNLLKMPDSIRPVLGNFRPVYDLSRPITALNADHRYYIKGSEFVEAKTAQEMLNAKVKMFMPADNEYIHRFFQGTDPIQSSTGLSNFASVVWDAYGMEAEGCCGAADKHLHPTAACILNGRTHDPKEMFTQSVLMGMHYRNYGERACRELVEWNQGQSYVEYKQQEWVDQGRSLMMRTELPERFQRSKTTGNPIGFTSSVETKGLLLGELESLVYTFGHNIKYLDFWSQLQEIEVDDKDGKKTWGTRDYKTFKDDLVIAMVLAKLCRDSIRESPMKVGTDEAPLTRTRYVHHRVATPMGHRLVQVPEVYTVKY